MVKLTAFVIVVALAAPAAAQHRFAASYRYDNASNITVAAAIGLDTIHSFRSQDRERAFLCQASRVGATIVLTEFLKHEIHKRRPDGSDFKSFPSGHTGVAMASAGWRLSVGFPIAVGTGVMRIKANKHDVVDVLGGVAIGYLSFNLCR